MIAPFHTYSGQLVDLVNPRSEQVFLIDIAVALSRINRFGGHSTQPYSVAQHSVDVSTRVRSEVAMLALMHDASEAYVGDMVTPLKKLLGAYREIEAMWQVAIGQAFGLDLLNLPEEIHTADVEAREMERNCKHFVLGPDAACELFLERYYDLQGSGWHAAGRSE